MTFNFRDPSRGLNLDFMTYAMYSLADENPEALLDASILQSLAQETFSTFFQHYVSSDVSLEIGSWAYQPINATLPSVQGLSLSGNQNLSQSASSSMTNRTVEAVVSTKIELLRVNPVAVWLSVSILIWLLVTTIIFAAVERRHYKGLIRNIECVADVMILVAGSKEFLQVAKNRTIEELDIDKESCLTKLGWFLDCHGEDRWGVEIWTDINSVQGHEGSIIT
jgi:hypothetical protein